MTTLTQDQLIESKELREQMAGRVEVLDKVKELLLIPKTEFATVGLVSEFYGVDIEAVKKVVQRNEDELLSDGMKRLNGREIKEELVGDNMSLTKFQGYFMIEGIRFRNNTNILLSRRAILRIGMLLQDSVIATEVRTQLLNIEEKVSNEVKIEDIDEEQMLAVGVGMAFASGDSMAIITAATKMMDFKNRHIEELKISNKALAGAILEWEDRSKLNSGVRNLASYINKPFGVVWNELYTELLYKHHISVKKRGGQPYLQWIKEDEWNKVVKSFAAMCEKYDVKNVEELLKGKM